MISERALAKLPVGRTLSDKSVKGFFALKGKRGVAFYCQRDTQRDGKRFTEKVRLDAETIADARSKAKVVIAKWTKTKAPSAKTLGMAWEDYKRRHLLRRRRSDSTIASYDHNINYVLASWVDKPLAKLGADREAIKRRHEEIGEAHGKPTADQALITFRAIYRYARADNTALAELGTFNFLYREKSNRRGVPDLASWWEAVRKLDNPVRTAFHVLCLLTGGRNGAMSVARWDHLNVKGRRWRMPKPKGGEDRAFDIPVSSPILRWLATARDAARRETVGLPDSPWIFPSRMSETGHIRSLSEPELAFGHALRRTFRSYADGRATQLEVKLLMNHALGDDITDAYADKDILWGRLLEAQGRISSALVAADTSKRKEVVDS